MFGNVLEGLDIISTIEDVPKGRGDKPVQDVTISDCGEVSLSVNLSAIGSNRLSQLEIEAETDAEGNQVPLHVEL